MCYNVIMNIKLSKFLSYVLRHEPKSIGITLDINGWVDVDVLIKKAAEHGTSFTLAELEDVVANNEKKRFTIVTTDGISLIRAAQGHSSAQVKMELVKRVPPDMLYHGTASKHLKSIMKQGLIPGTRHHVHLSSDSATAMTVGGRHGRPVLLKINTKAMYEQGYHFYLSDNEVWLTDNVPSAFIYEK